MHSKAEPEGVEYEDRGSNHSEALAGGHGFGPAQPWAAFDLIREDRLALIRKYPNRKQTDGVPYEGIAGLPEASRALAWKVPTSY